MSVNNKKKANVDILGTQWVLASGGKVVINKCQTRIWELQSELKGYGALFKNQGDREISSEELYGIGLSLERMGRRLEKISEVLSKSISSEH